MFKSNKSRPVGPGLPKQPGKRGIQAKKPEKHEKIESRRIVQSRNNEPTILVSTNTNVSVVGLDTGRVVPFIRTPPPISAANWYYGITWLDDRLFFTHSERPSSIVEYNRDGNCVNQFFTPVSYPSMLRTHQMIAIEDKLVAVSTNNDYLFRFSLNGACETFNLLPGTGFKKSAQDSFHFNSVWYEKELLYLVANNHGNSTLRTYNYPQMTLVRDEPLGLRVHNIWRMHGDLWFCNSGDGTIRNLSGRIVQLSSWCRGVALSDKYLVVGMSGLAERKDRAKVQSTICVMDSQTLEPIKNIELIGNIADIRFVNELDHAHRPEVFYL